MSSSISAGKSYQQYLVNFSAKANQNDTNAIISQKLKQDKKMSITTKCAIGGIVFALIDIAGMMLKKKGSVKKMFDPKRL